MTLMLWRRFRALGTLSLFRLRKAAGEKESILSPITLSDILGNEMVGKAGVLHQQVPHKTRPGHYAG